MRGQGAVQRAEGNYVGALLLLTSPITPTGIFQQALACHHTQTSYADAAWDWTQAWQVEITGGVSCCTLQNAVCKYFYGSFLLVTPVI